MQTGDLARTSVDAILRTLGSEGATGCLRVLDPVGEQALVYLRDGNVYAVVVPGRRPQIGVRLVASGALSEDTLAEVLEVQRTELQGWRLGELAVHLGYVPRPVVERYVTEQLQEACTDLLGWTAGRWRFQPGRRTREDVGAPMPVAELLDAVAGRAERVAELLATGHGPGAVPLRIGAPGGAELDPDARLLLDLVDGRRSVADLARECGFTLYEALRLVDTLAADGLVAVRETVPAEAPPVPETLECAGPDAPAPTVLEHVEAPEPEPEPTIVRGPGEGLAAGSPEVVPAAGPVEGSAVEGSAVEGAVQTLAPPARRRRRLFGRH